MTPVRGALAVLLISLSACSWAERGVEDPSPPPGVNLGAGLHPLVEQIRSAGVVHVRTPMWWAWWGPEQESAFDQVYAAADGLQVLTVVNAPPGDCYFGECVDRFATFMAERARQYPDVAAWQVMNEYGGHSPMLGLADTPERGRFYARLLCAVRDSVQATGSQAKIITAAIPPTNPFLSGFVAAGGEACADAVALHAYTPNPVGEARRQVQILREYTMLPIWVTETGFPTENDALHQAKWQEIAHGMPRLGVDRWYGFTWQWGVWGVVRDDGTPRSTYEWLRETNLP